MKGIDISNWQEGTNLKNLAIDFAICKATEGLDFVDWTCDGFIQQALKKKICFGYYHFASRIDAKREAEFFWNKTVGYTGHGIPVLDYECWVDNYRDVEFCEAFLKQYHKLSGVWPILYISASHCSDFEGSWIPEKCGLWVAGYPAEFVEWYEGDMPYDVSPWPFAAIWQFTDCLFEQFDGDVAYMDSNGWKKYAIGDNLKGKNETISKAPVGTKSYEDIAAEVVAGKWGDGWNRQQALEGAGYDYELVQRMVNALVYAERVDYNGC